MDKLSGSDLISVNQAFEAMRVFLESYWQRNNKKSDDIAILLGSINRARADASPLDPAQWRDWLNAIAMVSTKE